MYYLKGKIIKKSQKFILVENQNVGYKILTLDNLEIEDDEIIYIHEIIVEQDIFIYGFKKENELHVFLLLLQVPGIGPKTGLRILNYIDHLTLIDYCLNDDIESISKIPGITIDNQASLICKIKRYFKNFDTTHKIKIDIKENPLYLMLKSLGYKDSKLKLVEHLYDAPLKINDKLSKALMILNESR